MCDWCFVSGGHPSRTPCFSLLLVLLAISSVLPFKSEAQTTDEYRTQVDQLRQEWQEAQSAYQEFLERESSAPIDTIRVGTLTVLTQHEFAALVESGTRMAWDSIRQLGSDTLLLVGKTLFVPGPGWQNRYDAAEHRATSSSSPLSKNSDENDAAARVLSSIGMLLLEEWKYEVFGWLGGRFEMQDANRTSLGWTYVELVTSPSQAVRACLGGDLNACGSALVLNEVENPELEWYNAAERRVVVGRRLPGKSPDRAQFWLECVRDSVDAACVQFLTAEADEVPPPLSLGARRTLVGVALESGGKGAYSRLVSTGTSDRKASLATAAGQTPDSLLASWRMAVFSARPKPTTLAYGGATTTILWIVLFAAAATRSSRWRLG
jgi:hypothetical protein